jgi:hypothetical protein
MKRTLGHTVEVRDRYSGAVLDLVAVEHSQHGHEAAASVRVAVRRLLGTGKYRDHKSMKNIWFRVYQEGSPGAEMARQRFWEAHPGPSHNTDPELESILAD